MNVALFFGGAGEEYEISLRSASAVLSAFPKKHTVMPIGITREGAFFACSAATPADILGDVWKNKDPLAVGFLPNQRALLLGDTPFMPDCAFPLLHGRGGEDGRVQGLLDCCRIPYVGCGVGASVMGMDKVACKRIAQSVGIPVAAFCALSPAECENTEAAAKRIESELSSYPIFIKPVSSGSSFGASVVRGREELSAALSLASSLGGSVLAEEYIEGAEVEFGLIERSGALFGQAVGEIDPGNTFYDYDTKYKSRTSRIFIPARVGCRSIERVREYAKALFRAIGCRGLARLDFFVRKDGEVVFNEINTMPGFTDISMFPMLYRVVGLSMGQLIDTLLENAVS